MFGLPEATLTLIRDYFAAQPDIEKVVIYGSRAMGREENGSDIDLAVWTKGDKNLAGKIKGDLEALSTPYSFDVTDYRRITHVPLKEHIDKVGREIYAR